MGRCRIALHLLWGLSAWPYAGPLFHYNDPLGDSNHVPVSILFGSSAPLDPYRFQLLFPGVLPPQPDPEISVRAGSSAEDLSVVTTGELLRRISGVSAGGFSLGRQRQEETGSTAQYSRTEWIRTDTCGFGVTGLSVPGALGWDGLSAHLLVGNDWAERYRSTTEYGGSTELNTRTTSAMKLLATGIASANSRRFLRATGDIGHQRHSMTVRRSQYGQILLPDTVTRMLGFASLSIGYLSHLTPTKMFFVNAGVASSKERVRSHHFDMMPPTTDDTLFVEAFYTTGRWFGDVAFLRLGPHVLFQRTRMRGREDPTTWIGDGIEWGGGVRVPVLLELHCTTSATVYLGWTAEALKRTMLFGYTPVWSLAAGVYDRPLSLGISSGRLMLTLTPEFSDKGLQCASSELRYSL